MTPTHAHLGGEVAVVTGASSGIGAATARELARRGAAVVLSARRCERLEAEAWAIRAGGGTALVIPADVSQAADVARVAQHATEAFGRTDILVNGAGVFWRSSLVASPPDEISHLVRVNLLGALLMTRAVLPGMLERRHGRIISVGSLAGRVAMEPLYSATKYGLRGFTLALRRQVAASGVSVCLVSPGNINTAMTSHVTSNMPEPSLVATAIADLVSRPRREIVVPRRHYAIALLEQALPGLADVVYRRRHWSPVRDEEVAAAWTS